MKEDKFADEMLSDDELDNVVGGAPGYTPSFEEIKKRTMENIKRISISETDSLTNIERNMRQKLRVENT